MVLEAFGGIFMPCDFLEPTDANVNQETVGIKPVLNDQWGSLLEVTALGNLAQKKGAYLLIRRDWFQTAGMQSRVWHIRSKKMQTKFRGELVYHWFVHLTNTYCLLCVSHRKINRHIYTLCCTGSAPFEGHCRFSFPVAAEDFLTQPHRIAHS